MLGTKVQLDQSLCKVSFAVLGRAWT